MNWINITEAFHLKDGIPFFGGIATVFFLYSCHAGAFPVYKTLRNNTTRRIKKVFRRSILLDLFIYFFIAAASFLTSPINPPELILYRPNLPGFDPDYFILIAKLGIIFNLFFSTPANYAGLRLSIFELIWGNSNLTNTKNIIVTVTVLSLITLIGALYDKILEYIELLGGFCSVIYCILIPGLIYAKNDNIKKSKFIKYLTIITVAILTLIGYTSGILTILFKMVKIYPEEEAEKK
jgi:amino acid permease